MDENAVIRAAELLAKRAELRKELNRQRKLYDDWYDNIKTSVWEIQDIQRELLSLGYTGL